MGRLFPQALTGGWRAIGGDVVVQDLGVGCAIDPACYERILAPTNVDPIIWEVSRSGLSIVADGAVFGDYISRTLDPHALTHVAEDCGAVDSHFIGQSDEEALFFVPVVRSSDDFDHLIVCGFVRFEPTRRTVHDLHAINGDVLPYTRRSIIRRLGSADETCLMASQRLIITLAIDDEIGSRCEMDLFLCSRGRSELMYRMA
jgi:hypothetical protein